MIDNGPQGFGFDRVEDYWESFSPLHHITAGAAPTVAFLGTNDALIPVSTGEQYCERLEAVGTRCELHLYDGAGHGFFNNRFEDTINKTDVFLESLGFISGPPTIEP